jgi:hypothetical protein
MSVPNSSDRGYPVGPLPKPAAVCDDRSWAVKLIFDGGQRRVDAADRRQRGVRVADRQHVEHRGTRHHRPACCGARAAHRDPVQRTESVGSTEFQTAQIQDQPAALHCVPTRVLGQSIGVARIDVAADADDGHRRGQPATSEKRGATLPRSGRNGVVRQDGQGGRSSGERRWSSHGDPNRADDHRVSGAERMLLEFCSGQLNSSRTS